MTKKRILERLDNIAGKHLLEHCAEKKMKTRRKFQKGGRFTANAVWYLRGKVVKALINVVW